MKASKFIGRWYIQSLVGLVIGFLYTSKDKKDVEFKIRCTYYSTAMKRSFWVMRLEWVKVEIEGEGTQSLAKELVIR